MNESKSQRIRVPMSGALCPSELSRQHARLHAHGERRQLARQFVQLLAARGLRVESLNDDQACAIVLGMCLLVLAYGVDREHPVVLAGNRDELYARPTAALAVWPDEPELCAGRDLSQGGTWLGVTKRGRFAALTNFRRGAARTGARSRGEVVLDYLRSSSSPEQYVSKLAGYAHQFGGFSVIAGDLEHEPYYFSNQGNVAQALVPGIYGLSNQWLDEPWPKVTRAKQRIGRLLERGGTTPDELCDAMVDLDRPSDALLPDTGVGLEWERMLSPIFIAGESYGTRAVTAVLIDGERRATIYERAYGPGGRYLAATRCELDVTVTPGA